MKGKTSVVFSVLVIAVLSLQTPAGAQVPPPPRSTSGDQTTAPRPPVARTSRLSATAPAQELAWARQIIDPANETGAQASMAVDPRDGVPYISYYDATLGDLRLASPVGPGSGNCGYDDSWWCRTVVEDGDVGRSSSLDIWYDGTTWKLGIAYYNSTTASLDYAQYTEEGGPGSWMYTTIEAGSLLTQVGQYASLRFSPAGEPAVAFDANALMGTDWLQFALMNPTIAGAPDAACTDPNFICQTIDSGEGMGKYASLAWSGDEVPAIAYYAANSATLKVAHQHAGGNCGDGFWQCDSISPMAGASAVQGAGDKISLQTGTGLSMTLAYYSGTADALWMASYPAGGAGNCGPAGDWQCDQIEVLGAAATAGENVALALALDGSGLPLIAYHDVGEGDVLKVARPAATEGNCGPGGTSWQCELVDDGLRGGEDHDVGRTPAVGFEPDGMAIVAYQDATAGDLMLARQEVVPPPATCGGVYQALADTALYSDAPDQPHGGDAQLQVASTRAYSRTALLAFDLGATIPPSSTITGAELELNLSQDPTPLPYQLQVRAVGSAWSEGTATWNNAPTLGAALAPDYYSLTAAAPLRVDVTTLVNLWATGAVTETSVLLQPAGPDAVDVRFYSREAPIGRYKPRLVVICSPYSPPPTYDAAAGDARQMAGFDRLEAASATTPTLRIENGAVRYASLNVAVPPQVAADGLSRAQWFTAAFSDALRLEEPEAELQLVRRSDDDENLFFRQRHLGIPVFPAEVVVHLSGGNVTSFAGGYVPNITVDPAPRLGAEQAEAIALALAGMGLEVIGDTQLRYLNLGLIGSPDRNTYLTWQVPLSNNNAYFIDAQSGALRHVQTHAMEWSLELNTAQGNGPSDTCYYWWVTDDDTWCSENGCNDDMGGDPEGSAAWWNIRDVYFYWAWRHLLDGYDGHSPDNLMYVHVGTHIGWYNARWVGGCGQRWEFGEGFASAKDIVGHEYTHAVIEHSSGLISWGDSGAINESMADVFGAFAETEHFEDPSNRTAIDPEIGQALPHGALRNMEDPTQENCGSLPCPDTVADYCSPTPPLVNYCDFWGDNGGIHANSNILNKVAWLIINGGFNNGYHIDHPMGVWLAEGFYYVLMGRLPSNADFFLLRDKAIETAYDLVDNQGPCGDTCYTRSMACSVQNAFASVGLGSGDGNCDGQDDVTALDTDGDRIPDFYANGTPHDNCPGDPNPKQENNDGNPWFAGPHDDMGDACDPDDDNDGAPDGYDNCPLTYNPGQEDTVDHPPAMHPNGVGDACDDPDGDGLFDHDWVTTVSDNCPSVSNHDQTDSDGDSVGDVCDPDRDGDGVCNVGGPLQPGTLGAPYGCVVGTPGYDNCLSKPNSDQADADNDSWGDVCDNCPTQWSIPNIDTDQDQYCDEYDPDADNDGICDNGGPLDPGPGVPVGCDPGPSGHDNCPTVWNPDQTDLDNDGIGRDCDGDELGAMAEHAIQENYDFWSHTTPMIDLELGPPQPHDGHPDYLGLGYLCEVDVELSVPFVAQVLDNMGNVIAQTGLDMDRPMQRSLIFAPAPYWVATGMKRTPGGALSEPLAADETGYRLRFAPLGGFVPNQAYTLTLEVHAGVTHQIYLPLVIRQH